MSKAKKLFLAMVVTAFIAIISYFQINGYYWDSRGLNSVPLITGIVFTLIAIYFLYRVSKEAGSPKAE